MSALSEALARRFDGETAPAPYLVFRTGVALVALARTSDVLAPVAELDHHRWVHGLEYAPWVEHVVAPALHTPLVPWLPALPDAVTGALVVLRTVFAVTMLLGLLPRTSAGLLALVGYGLVALDRYRYLHHLHLLWLSCAWLALVPPISWRAVRTALVPAPSSPRWPLQLLRFQALVAWAASGVAKLRPDFLDGTTLEAMHDLGLVDGPLATLVASSHGARVAVAWTACATELLVVALLVFQKTRLAGVALAVALHVAIAESMMVSTFTAQMLLYAALFLPWRHTEGMPKT